MLTITVPEQEFYNSRENKFYTIKEKTLQLEHSLLSISKWEAKWKKPFLSKEQMTTEQFVDYIRCMTLTPNIDADVYQHLGRENYNRIAEYINDPMTATWFSDDKRKGGHSRETVTSELVYYWMVALNIPFECQKWHFNRLITLIKICNIKNAPPKKMKKNEILARNRALNEARRKALNSSG